MPGLAIRPRMGLSARVCRSLCLLFLFVKTGNSMMEVTPDTVVQLELSTFEEQAWLQQQQYPEQVLKHFSAWRFTNGLSVAQLEHALEQVIASLPALNARYRFDDQGELRKSFDSDWRSCLIDVNGLESSQIEQCLLTQQVRPWEAEQVPPLQVLLVQDGHAVVVGLILHQVLDQTCREDDLYRMLIDACAGRPITAPHLPWLHRDSGHVANLSAMQTGTTLDADAALSARILDEFRLALGESHMTEHDDFFDFGGHSLLATRIIGTLMARHAIEVQFNDFFSAPTAAGLAARARALDPSDSARQSEQVDEVRRAPFALAQDSLGRAYAAYEFGTIFNLPFAMTFLDEVDETLFEQAFADLIQRHASLRSTFHFEENEAYQQVLAPDALARCQWFWSSDQSHGATLASEAAYRFDLSRELPIRVRFLRDPQHQRQTLSLLVHHMAIDEWSLNVMMQELDHAYRARAAGKAPVWSAPARAFHTYAVAQQAKGINQRNLAYWTDMLRPATPGLTLPAIGCLTASAAGEDSTRAQWFEIQPEQAQIDQLYAFARQNNASLFGVIYSAIALALHKVGGLSDLVVGTSASGRTDPAYYDTVGYFTTMVAHRVQFDARQTVGSLIEGTSRLINESMAYADVPMEHIQQALGMTPADGLLFDVYIQIHASNALNGALTDADGRAIRYRQIDPDKNQSMFGIQFEIMENMLDGQRSLRLVVTYRSERYSVEQMARVGAAIEQVFTLFMNPDNATLTLQHLRV